MYMMYVSMYMFSKRVKLQNINDAGNDAGGY